MSVFGPFDRQRGAVGTRDGPCMVTFRIFLPATITPEPDSIYLYGSWNGYQKPSRLQRDSRSGPGIWKEQIPASGLTEGTSYGYYYLLDNRTLWYDPSAKLCVDVDINETVMVLEVPILLPDGVSLPSPEKAETPECEYPNVRGEKTQRKPLLQISVPNRELKKRVSRRLKTKLDSPTVRFDASTNYQTSSQQGNGSNFRSLPTRNISKRKSFTNIFSMGSASASTETLPRHLSLKKSWVNLFKGRRHASHADLKSTETVDSRKVQQKVSQRLAEARAAPRPEKNIGLGIVIPQAKASEAVQYKPSRTTRGQGHLRRPSIPDEWRNSIPNPGGYQPPMPSERAKLTIRPVPNTSATSSIASSRGTRKRSNAVVERRSSSFDEPETPLDIPHFSHPTSSISSLSSCASEISPVTVRDSYELKRSRKILISPAQYNSGNISPALGKSSYSPSLMGLQGGERRVGIKNRGEMARELWLDDVVIV